MIIDFHAHAFPERLAAHAVEKLGTTSGLFPHTDGTISSLRELMRRDGIDKAVLLPIATTPASQRNVNDFAVSCDGDDIIAFGSVHPDAPDALEELDRLHALGVKGIKFHPEYQDFFVNDAKMKPIYRKISELGMITLFHAGPDYAYRPPYHCTPDELYDALKWLDCPVVAAHWGGVGMAEEVIHKLQGIEHLYLDTAFGYGTNIHAYANEIIDTFGPEHILFASDAPWHPPMWEICLMETLSLPDDVLEAIYSGNARRLLGI